MKQIKKAQKRLSDALPDLVDTAVAMAEDGNLATLTLLLERAFPSQLVKELEAKTTGDIINLLHKGEISIKEARDLMEMMRTKSEIDLSKDLLKQIKKLNKKR